MSDTGILQQFNINELAGATGLILGAVSGILVVVFKSRCYCRLNLCYLCFCERKPPPDVVDNDSDDDEKKDEKKDGKKKDGKKKDGSKIDPPEKSIPSPKLQRKDSMIITEEELTKDNDRQNTQESSYP